MDSKLPTTKKRTSAFFRFMALLHGFSVLLLVLSLANILVLETAASVSAATKACLHLKDPLSLYCVCNSVGQDIKLVCKGLNSTQNFDLESYDADKVENNDVNDINNAIGGGSDLPYEYKQSMYRDVSEILVKDSDVPYLILGDFASYRNLQSLSVVNSHVTRILQGRGDIPSEDWEVTTPRFVGDHTHSSVTGTVRPEKSPAGTGRSGGQSSQGLSFPRLTSLDVSGNKITQLSTDDIAGLESLAEVNISRNALTNPHPDLFASLPKLKVLDLSSNQLDETVNPKVFTQLSDRLSYLDISNNAWTCSPELAWIYAWSAPLTSAPDPILANVDTTRCRYDNDYSSRRHDGHLLLVMEHYSKYVLPTCPTRDECTCRLTSVQEKVGTVTRERVYTVLVECSGKALTHFPKLPKHTRTVDLSGNLLDDNAFSILRVDEHNYDEVNNLTLDNNLIEFLPEKLLEMKLGLRFSAKHNKLTSIPYDFSQRLMKTTTVIELSNNPWTCSCTSQITDLNLIAKISDRKDMVCGPDSEIDLIEKEIYSLKPDLLCPPESSGEYQELLLQLLCVIFALLIIFLPVKLAYDYYVFRSTGKLPKFVLKLP